MRSLRTNDAEFELAIKDAVDNRLGVVDTKRHHYLRVLLMKRTEQSGQHPFAWARRSTHHKVSGQLIAFIFQTAEQVSLGTKDALRMAIRDVARFGRLDDATRAIDQLAAKTLFERTNRE